MDVRYQVFVSSTFSDLKEERDTIFKTLMQMNCIPAGMELFPALDDDQFAFIKRVIDDSDYYVLVIGGRYGSLSADGISYTEKEFDYAVSKGIKVVALVHDALDELPVGKSEADKKLQRKLRDFKARVMDGRLVKFWNKGSDLGGMVALSLTQTQQIYPAIGWVRADRVPSTEILQDINEIRKENEALRAKIAAKPVVNIRPGIDIAGIDEEFEFTVHWTHRRSMELNRYSAIYSFTWAKLFLHVSPFLTPSLTEKGAGQTVVALANPSSQRDPSLSGYVDRNHLATMRIQLEALELIETAETLQSNNTYLLNWELTETGRALMVENRIIKPSNVESLVDDD